LTLIDFSHLSHRNLYIAISQVRTKKVDGKYVTSDFINFYYHLMLQSLRFISNSFKNYGDIIICIDSKMNWRKEIYPDYKGHRKKGRDESEIDFEDFFKHVDMFVETLDNLFPYKVLKVERAEADDIIGVLAKKYSCYEKTVVVSSDKDFKQILEFGSELYDPIKKQNIKMTEAELKEWKLMHILLGDEGDNIPHIKRGTQFTDTFLAHLKTNNIFVNNPEEFNELTISKKIYSEFKQYKKNKKGEILDELDIFKATPFGKVTAESFMLDLANNLKENKIFIQNFQRNKQLVLFSEIPEDIVSNILSKFQELDFRYDPSGIMKFLSSHSLTSQIMNITDFYVEGNKSKERNSNKLTAIEEWI